MQSVLVVTAKIHLSVRSLSSFWERPTFSSVLLIRPYRNKHGQQKSKEKRCSPTDRGIYTTTTTTTTTTNTTITRSILWHWTWTNDRFPPNRYNPTLKTQVIFAVIWDSIPVRGKCIKAKEIPYLERNTLKETPYLDSISHPTCGKLAPYKTGYLTCGDSLGRSPYSDYQRRPVLQNLTTSLKLIETDKCCLTTVLRWIP